MVSALVAVFSVAVIALAVISLSFTVFGGWFQASLLPSGPTTTNFRELRKTEVQLRRMKLLRTRVNKGKKLLVWGDGLSYAPKPRPYGFGA